MSLYYPPDPNLWSGRADSLPDERFFQRIQTVNLQQQTLPPIQGKAIALLGFCCDTGIKRNVGRMGAAAGPAGLRTALGKLPLHHATKIYDVGDVICNDNLALSQTELATTVTDLLNHQLQPIIMGGGHEIAWGHYQGIRKKYSDQHIGIINFDAHFDLRPVLSDGEGSSGTPFLQIANHSQQHQLNFDYCVVGLQANANTRSLFNTAKDLNVSMINALTLQTDPNTAHTKVKEFIAQQQLIYLTVCMDVFSAAIAPGVSAPQSLGLFPHHLLPLLQLIMRSGKVISADVAELSPAYDRDNMTANLAAQCVAEIIEHWAVPTFK